MNRWTRARGVVDCLAGAVDFLSLQINRNKSLEADDVLFINT